MFKIMSTTKENRVVVNEHIYIVLSMADRHCTKCFPYIN